MTCLPISLMPFGPRSKEIETSVLIVNVVDVSDPRFRERTEAVDDILESLHLDSIPRLTVFNKLDQLDPHEAESFRGRKDAVAISALTGEGSETLVTRIGEIIREQMVSGPTRSKSLEDSTDF